MTRGLVKHRCLMGIGQWARTHLRGADIKEVLYEAVKSRNPGETGGL